MIQVDLHALTIPHSTRVWRLFPGESYQFLPDFVNKGVGFLDLPAFPVPPSPLSEAQDLIDRIAFSQSFAEACANEQYNLAANLQLSTFKDSRQTAARTRTKNSIVAFYEEAKQNDLVVLPEPKYLSAIRIGRFSNSAITHALYEKSYGKGKIPARAIEWLGVFKENTISSGLSESLRNQHPFTLLPRSLFVEAFALAYGSFIYGDKYVSTLQNGADFLDADATFLGFISRLASAACQAIDEGKQGLGGNDILKVLFSTPDIVYTSTQQCDIHSPGFMRYIPATVVPLVAVSLTAGLIHLSEHSSKQSLANDIQTMVIVNNTPGASPQCTARVSEATSRVLTELGIDKTWALCQSAKDAKVRAGIKPSARVH